jgi:3-dehydroquinate synthase
MKSMKSNETIAIGRLFESNFIEILNLYSNGKIGVVCDENTQTIAAQMIQKLHLIGKTNIYQITLPSGEQHKNLESLSSVWQQLTENNFTRKDLLINVGGGVITDLGGFAAATYKRGIEYINIPTTLLSMVDASVGGKTGIDYQGFKNQIGAFHLPKGVYVDPEFLKTLPQQQLLSGYAEVLKHGLIADANYWEYCVFTPFLEVNWNEVILKSIEIKNGIVSQDPQEIGLRKVLNFGHTVGHAVETYYINHGEELLHGMAVVVGMICEAHISFQKGNLGQIQLESISKSLSSRYNKVSIKESCFPEILQLMYQDKKNNSKGINVTLLNDIGSAQFDGLATEEEIYQSLHYYGTIKS